MQDDATQKDQRWLLLIHRLPSKPGYLRVKIWRRLRDLGAVAVKSTVYALPANADTQEDFQWLLKEIDEGGGEAMVCEARFIDGLSDAQARAIFDTARDEDYGAIAKEARALSARLDNPMTIEDKAEARLQAARLGKRLSDIAMIDFFGATGRLSASSLVVELGRRLADETQMTRKQPDEQPTDDYFKGRTWITREGVQIDRIACSWLIRRFIDPAAVIRFVPGKGYMPKPGELRFDMYEGEITHEGDRCSFEVLLTRAALTDSSLQAIAEIIHDIDLKDGKFGREETTGIASLITGICSATAQDDERIVRGSLVLDNLYQYFRARRS